MDVLITGASRGIGRACAEHFAAAGHRVTALARSGDELERLRESYPTIVPEVCDLTRRTPVGTYDVLVLNAGYYAPGGLLDPGTDVFTDSWELNVMANHRLARSLVPPMIRRGRGHLLAIGSTVTDETDAHMTAYGATKRALRALYTGWSQELAGTGVRTTLIAPGATLTSSWDGEVPPPHILPAARVAELVLRCVTEGLTGRVVLKA